MCVVAMTTFLVFETFCFSFNCVFLNINQEQKLVLISPDDYIKLYFLVSTTIITVLIILVKHPRKTNTNAHNNAYYYQYTRRPNGQPPSSTLQNVRNGGPITNQAGGNYVTSALDMIGQFFYKYR